MSPYRTKHLVDSEPLFHLDLAGGNTAPAGAEGTQPAGLRPETGETPGCRPASRP